MHITKFHQDNQDPIVQGQHQGQFQYWFGSVPIEQIKPNYSIDDLCQTANLEIGWFTNKVFEYTDHRAATFDIAQFVKINMLYHSLRQQPNIKPWLLYYNNGVYRTCTGDTRRRAMELLPEIVSVPALICAPVDQQFSYQPIESFDEFAQATGAPLGTPFWFNIAAPNAGYGIEWYEVALDSKTGTVGPSFRDRCCKTIQLYMREQPANFKFDRLWFTQHHEWDKFS